jgi:surface protein
MTLCANIDELDVTGWDLSKTTDIQGLFADSKTKKIIGLNTWDTSNITNIIQLFYGLPNVEELDLSSFDLSKVTNADQLFDRDESLKKIITPAKSYSNDISSPLPAAFKDDQDNEYTDLNKDTKTNTTITKFIRNNTFINGKLFNEKIKKISGTSNATYSNINTNITAIKRSENAPNTSLMTESNIDSESNENPIYAWFDNGTIYYYSESPTLHLPQDSSYMFYELENVSEIEFTNPVNKQRLNFRLDFE